MSVPTNSQGGVQHPTNPPTNTQGQQHAQIPQSVQQTSQATQPVQPKPAPVAQKPIQQPVQQPKVAPMADGGAKPDNGTSNADAPKKESSVPNVNPEFAPVDLDPSDKVAPASDDQVVDISALIEEHKKNVSEGRTQVKNLEKFPLDVPMDPIRDINTTRLKELASDKAMADDKMADVASDYSSMERSMNYFTGSLEQLTESLKHIQGNLEQILKRSRNGVGDADATLASKFKGKDRVELSETDSYMTMATMTGGMRRITLWNSGFHVTLRKIPLALLNEYYKTVNQSDYEYGKEFGAFYYNFADLAIKEHIIEYLLPVAICTSNYAHWRNTDKLLSAISLQDFDTLMWGMACMMHPQGAMVNFVCGKPNCGHVHRVKSDLTKLRLLNTDLINDEMIAHFKKGGPVTDEDLQTYRQNLRLNRALTFEMGDVEDGDWRKWIFNLKQISLADHLEIGRDFNAELRRAVHVDNRSEVGDYLSYNLYRTFKPWIDSVECTTKTVEGKDQTLVWHNTGSDDSDKTMYMALENVNMEVEDFEKRMQDYITDTRISHIAFYMPKCPKCGKAPEIGYHGYIPYDAMRNFFTLALMKLLRRVSIRNRTNSSPSTTE